MSFTLKNTTPFEVTSKEYLIHNVIHQKIKFKINLKSEFRMMSKDGTFLEFNSNKKIRSYTFYGTVDDANHVGGDVILNITVDRFEKTFVSHEFPPEVLVPTEYGDCYRFLVCLSDIEIL